MPIKCLLWGISDSYQQVKNLIDFEILKNNLSIVAAVSRDKLYKTLDGFDIIDKSEINQYEFEYIIIAASKNSFKEIKNEILSLGIDERKIINPSVFSLPCFDFKKYVSLIENPVSIVCHNCLGGHIYHALGLQFSSPFINFYINNESFYEMLNNLDYTFKADFEVLHKGDFYNNISPVIKVKGKDILFNLVHNVTVNNFIEKWEKRKKRINYNNIIVLKKIDNDDDLEHFMKIPYERKVGLYYKDVKHKSIVYLSKYANRNTNEDFGSNITYAFDEYAVVPYNVISEVNIFNLLTKFEDFKRF